MMQGMKPAEAHAEVTRMQQQGFVDYAQQALMHLQGGNPNAAATALRAAYQYFPNGTDVQLGVQQGKDGQPVIVGQGRDEETGEPKGQPMIINGERLAVMIENFSNPDAFRTWTKDWRDEQFNRQKYEEVEKPEAESNARYRDRAGRAALVNAEADRIRAGASGAGGRRQVDLDRANAAFTDAVELMGYTDEAGADQIMSLMSQIYARSSWQYPEVIDFVRKAKREGRLPEVMEALGLGTPAQEE
jgi:phage I-like protein